MSAREVIAYAITHAGRDAKGKAIKGGPYEGEYDKLVPTLREAWRGNRRRAKYWLAIVRRTVPHARVIRIVRARPSESATEVLRELVAWWEAGPPTTLGGVISRALRVLAAAGPDPMPVVRAALRYWDYGPDGRLGPAWVGFREAVDAYRKAGGK